MDYTVGLLLTYRYLLLLPLSMIEGPIITIIAGFFVSTNLFNPAIVYGIVVAGDFIGDTIVYSIGRWGGKILHSKRFGKYFGMTPEKMALAKERFSLNHKKTIVLSKIIHGFGITGLTTAGVLKIPYSRYIATCMATTIIQSGIFLIAGILFGHTYKQLSKYLDYFAATTILIGIIVVAILIYKKYNANTHSK